MKGQMEEVIRFHHLCFSSRAGDFFDINLEAYKGEVHGIVMPITQFRSPFYDLFKGNIMPDSGTVYINNEPVNAIGMKRILEKTVCTIGFQTSLIPSLTLAENLFLVDHKKGLFWPIGKNDIYEKAKDLFRLFKIEHLFSPYDYPDKLTLAKKHIIELIRAYIQETRVIYMDNITIIYSDEELEQWSDIIKKLADMKKYAILLIINAAFKEKLDFLDRLTVIKGGTTAMQFTERPFHLISSQTKNVEDYSLQKLGDQISEGTLLVMSHFFNGSRLLDINFSILPGEAIGVFNPGVFEGQEFMEALLELPKLKGGMISYRTDMLFYKRSLFQNVILRTPDNIKRTKLFARKRVTKFLYTNVMKAIHGQDLMEEYGGLKCLPEGKVTKEQSIRIQTAKWLFYNVDLLLFFSPESYYDTLSVYKFSQLLEDLHNQNVAVIIISENFEFLKKCGLRILEIKDGVMQEFIIYEKEEIKGCQDLTSIF